VPSHRAVAPDVPVAMPLTRAAARAAGGPLTTGRRSSARPGRPQPSQLSAPQIGIAGVLGLATIAAPISGALAGTAPKAAVNTIAALPAAPQIPARHADAGLGVRSVSVVPVTTAATQRVPEAIAAPKAVVVDRAARTRAQPPVLPGCDGVRPAGHYSNGQLPSSVLCTLWNGTDKLRADAAVSVAKLNVAYRQRFGHDLCISDSYRSLDEQYTVKALKPGLAALPGTSEHGWGLALDVCDGISSGLNANYYWMRANAPRYGWDNPDWARAGGGGPYEPWHWEYLAGE
jgi:D-alanyl-D-alanine carboxypeptidase